MSPPPKSRPPIEVIDFKLPSIHSSWPLVALGAVAVTVVMFLLIPFTQLLKSTGKPDTQMVQVDIAPPPPPPPPEPPEADEPETEQTPPPPPAAPPPQLSLSQLDLALEPGVGDAMAGAFGFDGFNIQPNALAEMKDFFSIKELDQNPRRVAGVTPAPPYRLRRDRVPGYTQALVEIDTEGHVRVISFSKTTHAQMEDEFLKVVDTFRYTPPTRNGEKVKARFYIPFQFKP